MNTKSKLSIICVLAFVGIIIGNIGLADTSTVTATVTIGDVQVTLTPTEFSYGTMPYGTSKESFDIIGQEEGDKNIKATVGSILTSLTIKGASTTDWTLEGSIGNNQYVHAFGMATDGTTKPDSYAALTGTLATLSSNIASEQSVYFGLKISTPSSGTETTTQEAQVIVQASWGEEGG